MSDFDKIIFPLVNVIERAQSRTLIQFNSSAVFHGVLAALVSEVQVLINEIKRVIELRGAADATGYNLNVIGRLVGQDREVFDYSEISWFSPDSSNSSADISPAWVVGAPLTESIDADDKWYRQLISGKIFRNYVKYGSIPEIQEMVRLVLGVEVSFNISGPMEVSFVGVSSDTPLWALRFLFKFTETKEADGIPYPPYPATLNIQKIFFMPNPVFIPDIEDHGADIGFAGIASSLIL